MKQFIKNKFKNQYFEINQKDDTLTFKLINGIPFSKSFLIIKNDLTCRRISKEIKHSKVDVSIDEILEIGKLGIYDVYIKISIANKVFFNKVPFKNQNSDKRIFDGDKKFIFKSFSNDSNLSFRLDNYIKVDDNLIDIVKVYGEDISDLISHPGDFKFNLTAVVLVYNGGEYLKPCLDSLVSQTIDGLEILLMNDASTDDSLEICRQYALKHDNVRIIDKQENHGLATSANMGIKIAKGEYVILVDNDDVIPHDAYEKLYNKAKEFDADISIGQANLLFDDRQNEMYDAERKVLEKERVIDNISEFPQLFNDAFYWNKIIRKSIIIDNNIELPVGMIYADRKFCHTAYIHAKTISIIPDCVYLWRIRLKDTHNESLSRKRKEADNYINRIDSYEIDLDKLTGAVPDYFKILMRRVIIPVRGILDSEEFEEAFYNRGVKLLKEECLKLNDIYDNQFDNWDNIIIYLALNDFRSEIREMLELDIENQRDIVNDNGKSYWNLPLFRGNVDIPDNLFEIKSMQSQFLNISKIITSNEYIAFEGIEIPKHLNVSKCQINFMGKTFSDGILKDNAIFYDINPQGENIFDLKVPLSHLADFEIYDIFFKTYYENRACDNFRVTKSCIESIEENCPDIVIGLTGYGNLSVISQRLDGIVEMEIEADKICVKFNENASVKQKLRVILENDRTHERFYISEGLPLDLKHCLDNRSSYSFYLTGYSEKVGNKNIRLTSNHIYKFHVNDEIDFRINEDGVKLFTN